MTASKQCDEQIRWSLHSELRRQILAARRAHLSRPSTITFIEEDQIRVNGVPKKLKDGDNNALTTPVTVTGTAEELDAELGPTLVNVVGAHLQLKNTLESAKADIRFNRRLGLLVHGFSLRSALARPVFAEQKGARHGSGRVSHGHHSRSVTKRG
jgi:PRTRC genetic system protein E